MTEFFKTLSNNQQQDILQGKTKVVLNDEFLHAEWCQLIPNVNDGRVMFVLALKSPEDCDQREQEEVSDFLAAYGGWKSSWDLPYYVDCFDNIEHFTSRITQLYDEPVSKRNEFNLAEAKQGCGFIFDHIVWVLCGNTEDGLAVIKDCRTMRHRVVTFDELYYEAEMVR